VIIVLHDTTTFVDKGEVDAHWQRGPNGSGQRCWNAGR